tara:strand:- start:743 stop:991 length:249 start_codon:yes stop_codon:yes gene_type:complete
MKFTINTKDKTIQLEEDFTKVEISKLFDILDIENIDEYRILSKTKDFWLQTNTYYPKIQSYSTDNTFDNNLKVVYKNIVDSL